MSAQIIASGATTTTLQKDVGSCNQTSAPTVQAGQKAQLPSPREIKLSPGLHRILSQGNNGSIGGWGDASGAGDCKGLDPLPVRAAWQPLAAPEARGAGGPWGMGMGPYGGHPARSTGTRREGGGAEDPPAKP